MADHHEALVRWFRRRILLRGLRETKSPMPSYRPDIYAERLSSLGRIVEQVAVEAEIATTLFSEHTTDQLVKMDEFIKQQKQKRIRARGFLIIPKQRGVRAHAVTVLESLFPEGTDIRIVEDGVA